MSARDPRTDPRPGDSVPICSTEHRVVNLTDTGILEIHLYENGKYIGFTACDVETWRRWNGIEDAHAAD